MIPESVSYKRDILGIFADPTETLYRVREYNILNPLEIDKKKLWRILYSSRFWRK